MTVSSKSSDHRVVLVVESAHCCAELSASLQSSTPARIVHINSASELPAAFETEAPSCLVCNLQLCQFERDNQPIKGTDVTCPVICIADSPQLNRVVHALQRGVFDVFATPIDQDALSATIERALQAEQMERETLAQRNAVAKCVETLTNREREVMSLVVEGLSLKQIASRLDVRFQTAAKHRARVLRKMGVANDVQLTLRVLPTQESNEANRVCRVSTHGNLIWC